MQYKGSHVVHERSKITIFEHLSEDRHPHVPVHIMRLQVIAGLGRFFWHTYMANDLSLWYIKTQFEDGREELTDTSMLDFRFGYLKLSVSNLRGSEALLCLINSWLLRLHLPGVSICFSASFRFGLIFVLFYYFVYY